MTLPQAELQSRVDDLHKHFQVPNEDFLRRRIDRIERIKGFYKSKITEAPTKQASMFIGFVSALTYAGSVLRMYRKLTTQLAGLSEKDDNGKTNNG